ncbi:MAG: gliding motility-associated C-terminal domain-containing protein [Bacteroidetes bacterium]|nr:gliding motility-associated C-terminal domain-containing protein [Bacteroidota bacterium]
MQGRNRLLRPFRAIPTLALLCSLASAADAQDLLMANGVTWNTCDGMFYDSGGPGGSYGNNQNFVATLCPGGGAGSGAASAVTFLSFQVGSVLDPGDRLVIHDGIGTAAPVLATGDVNNSFTGLTFTATGMSGCLTFHWTSSLLGNAPGWEARLITGPDAGTNASLTLCGNQPPFLLADALGGDPDVGGAWTGPNGPHSALYDPTIDPGGAYTYTVIDGSLCRDSATVTITNVAPPDPGQNGTLLICTTSPPVQLINSLGGTPGPGGTWTGPAGPHDGSYDPATDPAGVYTYNMGGHAPCPSASATVTVALTAQPDAGLDGTLTTCNTVTALDLLTGLGGSPDIGGSWTDPGNTGALNGGTVNTTGLAEGTYTFTYTVTATGCGSDVATVTVAVADQPDAGLDGALITCNTATALDLFTGLGGSPDAGGTWVDLDGTGALAGSTVNIGSLAIGTYTFAYTVAATGCSNDTARVTVTLADQLDAGLDGTLTTCNTVTALELFAGLGGSPDLGGTWTDPGNTGALNGGTVNTTGLAIGTYAFTYVVMATGCGSDTARVTVAVTGPPDAGLDGALITCDNGTALDLFTGLGGSPDTGGTWLDLGGTGALTGSTVNTTGLAIGTYTFAYTVAATGCSNDTARVTVTLTDQLDAGLDGTLTACDTVMALDLFAGLGGSPDLGGTWIDPGNTGALNGGTVNTTNLTAGTYPFAYVVTATGCGSDTAQVDVHVVDGVHVGDPVRSCDPLGRSSIIAFLITGGDPDSYAVSGVPGTVDPLAPFTFTSDTLPDSLAYTIHVTDANACRPVTFTVEPCFYAPHVFVPQSFSPNGDGINDTFQVPGLEDFPGNEMFIFNRWGAKIYRTKNYHEPNKAWKGSMDNISYTDLLPPGTYYYVLDLGPGNGSRRGFIQLNR